MQSKTVSNGVQEPSSQSLQIHAEQERGGASLGVLEKVGCKSKESTSKQITHSENSWKQADRSHQIPPRPVDISANNNLDEKDAFHLHGSLRGNSSVRGFFRGRSFKNQTSMHDESSSLLDSGLAATIVHPVVPENAIPGTYIAARTWKRCASLPVTHAKLSPSTYTFAKEVEFSEHQPAHRESSAAKVSRSLSVPVQNVVILRSGSFPTSKEPIQTNTSEDQISPAHLEDGDEEIPEEDAVCRVCLDGLCVGGSSLKLECSCKGALSLMHEECALKWFSIKGNKKCDVCGQEILNLPVTLLRMQSSAQRNTRQLPVRASSNSRLTRAWQDKVALILISTMCYFLFLEQLLVVDMKSQAIIVAAPFSFSLGLLASMFAIVLACKEYVWAYSAFQFALVVTFLHIFYAMLQLRAVYAILFAAIVGFGIALGINSMFLIIFARRFRVVQTLANPSPV